MIEITTIVDFKKYKSIEGYIVIVDTTGTKVHSNKCRTVEIDKFKKKVIDNNKKMGQYLFTNDLIEAVEYPKVKKCDICRKDL